MTTLAIIGAGIAGRSLLWALAKENKSFSKIVLFDGDSFLPSCSYSTTATVALRGVSPGHSVLGDTLYKSFHHFKKHVDDFSPSGVHYIRQFSAVSEESSVFSKRFAAATSASGFLNLKFKSTVSLYEEESFLIEPVIYLNWLLKSAQINFEHRKVLVKRVHSSDSGYDVLDSEGGVHHFQKVIYTTGVYQKSFLPELKTKSVQGAYFELNGDLGENSFSLTLDGHNLVYHSHTQKLLIGSTSVECSHLIAPETDLISIFSSLESKLNFVLPALDFSKVRIGLREKAPKRSPYLIQRGEEYFIGGFYKNGFSLALYMANDLIKKLCP